MPLSPEQMHSSGAKAHDPWDFHGTDESVPFQNTNYASSPRSLFLTYCTLPAAFSRTTSERIAVSDLSGRCEQNPMPT